MMNSSRDERQAAAKPAGGKDQAGQLRPVPLQPSMVYNDPDEFFRELLMEQNEHS